MLELDGCHGLREGYRIVHLVQEVAGEGRAGLSEARNGYVASGSHSPNFTKEALSYVELRRSEPRTTPLPPRSVKRDSPYPCSTDESEAGAGLDAWLRASHTDYHEEALEVVEVALEGLM
jgi:hypothetical protein